MNDTFSVKKFNSGEEEAEPITSLGFVYLNRNEGRQVSPRTERTKSVNWFQGSRPFEVSQMCVQGHNDAMLARNTYMVINA